MVQDLCIQGSQMQSFNGKMSAVFQQPPTYGAASVTSPHDWGALGSPRHAAPPPCTHTHLWKGKEKKRMLEKPIATSIKKQSSSPKETQCSLSPHLSTH